MMLIILGAITLSYLLWENNRHRRNLERIPLRIHVNGTRGKSSVTRLIAAGLRAGGIRTIAKTTGSAAMLLLPDGGEQSLKRKGPANIRETIGFIQQAVQWEAQAVVAECMAVRPELQHFLEHRFLRSHIGAITNIRADHEDIMGHGLANVAAALANTIPNQGVLFIPCDAALWLAGQSNRASAVITVSANSVTADELAPFPFEVIPENVALALAICEQAGVTRQHALAGMYQAKPDIGNVTVTNVKTASYEIRFINALAANDPESTLALWHRYVGPGENTIILLNCRADRRQRTAQLVQALSRVHQGMYALSGDSSFGLRQLRQAGISGALIHRIQGSHIAAELDRLAALLPTGTITVFAAGNIKGVELPCRNFSQESSYLCSLPN